MTAKRVLCLLLLAASLLTLTACQQQEQRTVPENQQAGFGNARWIWKTDTVKNNDWGAFRRDFTLESAPETAEIRVACDSKYVLWVNGNILVRDGGVKRGDTYYDTVEIASNLRAGENSLALLVWYWGPGEEVTHYTTSGVAGLIVSTELYDQKAKCTVETGDGHWYAANETAYQAGGRGENPYLGEQSIVYDARLAVDWTAPSFDAAKSGWEQAREVGRDADHKGYAGDRPWGQLNPRPIPMFQDGERVLFAPEQLERSENTYHLRLPYNMQLYPYLELGTGTVAGQTLTARTETWQLSGLELSYTTRDGEQAYESVSWINGDDLYFEVPEGVEVVRLGYRQTGYAVTAEPLNPFQGSFTSREFSDGFTGGWFQNTNVYDELWRKAAVSLYVCMRDTYMDCPDRERGQYIGDAVNEIEEAFYALGPGTNALSAKAIREICASQVKYEYSGRTYYAMSSLVPIVEMHEIPIQELGTAVAAWQYYLYTGDASVPQDCFLPLYQYLTNYRFETKGEYEGTIRMRSAEELKNTFNLQTSRLDQWSDWGSNQDTRIAVTCWWYLSAKALRNLADVEGVQVTEEQLAYLEDGMARVEANFETFWNPELEAYATSWGDAWNQPVAMEEDTHLVDDRVNALAVLAGLADASHREALLQVFARYENASIYMERYVLEALYQLGDAQGAMDRMKRRHLAIVDDPDSSTLPELWHEGGVNDFENYEGTKNHGWSGGSLLVLSRYAAGIAPLAPAYAQWQVIPQMGGFDELHAVVPAEIGKIEMVLTEDKMTVTSPGQRAEIYVPMRGDAPAVYSMGTAELIGVEEMYGQRYTHFTIQGAGTYEFDR